jgi:hypothetical protein
VRVDAAAVDAAGRVVIARRAGDARRRISVIRLRRDRLVDRAFGRVSLQTSLRARPMAVLPQRSGRVTIVAQLSEVGPGDREDFEVLDRGTAAFRLRTR